MLFRSALAAVPPRPEAAVAIHWGRVQRDGELVTGPAVERAAGLAAVARPGDVLVSRQAHAELSSRYRLRCVAHPDGAVEALLLDWRRRGELPTRVHVKETGEDLPLPVRPTLVFGRSGEAADVAVPVPEEGRQRVSRRHFELRRQLDELYLYPLVEHATTVDSQPVAVGECARVTPGTIVRLGGVVTLAFLSGDAGYLDTPGTRHDASLSTIAVASPKLPDRG